MHSILVDAAALAVPNYAESQQEAISIIDRVVHIAELISPDMPVRVLMTSNAVEALMHANAYPTFQALQDFLEMVELNGVYGPGDLLSSYANVLSNCQTPTEVGCFEVDAFDSVDSVPNLPTHLHPDVFANESLRAFATVATQRTLGQGWILGLAFPSNGSSVVNVSVKGGSFLVPDDPATEVPGIDLSADVILMDRFGDLVSTDFAQDLWSCSESATDIHLSIAVGACALLRVAGHEGGINSLRPFSVGSDFFESLNKRQCALSGQFAQITMQKCARVIAGVESGEPFRTTAKSTSPQRKRKRDSALGWRLHVTKGNAALRLMYWRSVAGEIEFSNIGLKNEEEILSGGNEGAAVWYPYSVL